MKAQLRLRVSEKDVHYAGGLAPGAYVIGLFGDVATELAIRSDGDEGLLVGYERIEVLQPVYAGDFLEIEGEIVQRGNTSRKMKFEAKKYITNTGSPFASSADVLGEKLVVARAVGTTVVTKNKQRSSS